MIMEMMDLRRVGVVLHNLAVEYNNLAALYFSVATYSMTASMHFIGSKMVAQVTCTTYLAQVEYYTVS